MQGGASDAGIDQAANSSKSALISDKDSTIFKGLFWTDLYVTLKLTNTLHGRIRFLHQHYHVLYILFFKCE